MDTKKYEVFEKTVELSSLTKAAEELGSVICRSFCRSAVVW